MNSLEYEKSKYPEIMLKNIRLLRKIESKLIMHKKKAIADGLKNAHIEDIQHVHERLNAICRFIK